MKRGIFRIVDLSKLFVFFLLAMLMVGSVVATSLPMIVYGTVEFGDVTYANQKVTIHSVELNHDWEFYTNDNGVYQVTLNNLRDDQERSIAEGQHLEIVACPEELNSACKQSVVVSNVPTMVSYSLDGGNLASDDAVDVKEVIKEVIVEVPGECAECQSDEGLLDDRSLWEIIASGLVLLGLGGAGGYFVKRNVALHKGTGVKFYTKRDGTEAVLHKHPGTRGYHEPKTSHNPARERHTRGQMNPKYEKNTKGEWCYKE